MDNSTAKMKGDNRIGDRVPVESGNTVIIHSGDQEIIGTINNKSEGGLGLNIPESYKQYLQQDTMMTVTYNLPYGLVSQSAQVCWCHSNKKGEIFLGTRFVEAEAGFQTNYQKIWKDFIDAEKLEDAAHLWLSLQSAMISGVTRGLVVLGTPESEAYKPIAFWPEGQRGTIGLTQVAELALQEKRGVLRDDGRYVNELDLHVCYIGFPLMLDEKVYGVVAFEIASRPEAIMRSVMRQLQWGTAWIELIIRRIDQKKYTPENQQLVTVLELIASSLQHEKFQASATSVATELATILNCERVSIGFLKGKNMQVRALSHSADFAKKTKLLQSIALAMDEAMDQKISLLYPAYQGDTVKVLRCHEKLIQEQGTGSVCTIPLSSNGQVFGALTLERPAGNIFTKNTVELCETIASMVGPILESKRRDDVWLITKFGLSIKDFVIDLIGPAHAGLKLASFLIVSFALFFIFAMGDFRISADSYLEGSIQRVIVTPFDGYISEAYVRAGDIVKKGHSLVKLDDNDLILERAKWASQKQQYLKEYRNALGKLERSKVSVLKAQLSQIDAQLAMVDAQLSRIQINAPFDGIIVAGDLSQSLGSPSQRGDVLFEIAPLEDYRVILEVDERDISAIEPGQSGELVLTGYSDQLITFKINSITPISEVKEGRNFFRVEAKMEQPINALRPGMKGVGKILIGQRKLIWIWSRSFIDWLRLSLWTWWPQGL